MNILPKKKWHVRTKENVARVRRDLKEAARLAESIAERAEHAEQEYKVNLLRKNADIRSLDLFGKDNLESLTEPGPSSSSAVGGHVNFFAELENEERKNLGTGNREYEEEKRKEQQEYESKIGILKYLGEGSKEFTNEKSWWESLPAQRDSGSSKKKVPTTICMLDRDRGERGKNSSDKKEGHRHKHEHKHKSLHKKKKRKRRSSTSDEESSTEPSQSVSKHERNSSLEELRMERMMREESERRKADLLLNGGKEEKNTGTSAQMYSSQFNPDLARQNRLK